ncbi:mechanosensitive ion channel family protein [Herminiimonas arsenitoxidans]|uniref:mechanosensitive ion channel family protein n=1 Tax=Herminiimonas arsenitoxidans TaxID=1809410 RepID=UPI000970D1A8|nr:mechanosensitive ion channel domain-containing protein [Herminiimonas arsenitoxidans]
MKENLLSTLWADLWTDLGIPGLRWQLFALVLCFVAGWGIARMVRGVIASKEPQKNALRRLGVESFARVLWPLLTWLLLAIAKAILERWDGVNGVDVLRVVMPLVASFALIRIAFYVMRRVFARGGKVSAFVLLFERSFATLVWIVVALHITGVLPDLIEFLDDTFVPLGKHKVSMMTMLQAVVSVGVTLLIALWASALIEERLMRLDGMHSSMRAVLSRMSRAVLVLIALLVSLSMVGIDLTVLSVFGGALGVGLGLGLQKIASSYVSGFIILLERSMTIGDTVTMDKFTGRVAEINTRYTVLRGGDGSDTILPNDLFVSNAVQNLSLSDTMVQMTTRISVDYRTDIDLALRLLEEAALSVAGVRQGPDRVPSATMVAFGADGIDLQLGFWVNQLDGRGGVLSNVNRAIWRSFQANEINVPFPQREIRLIDEQYRPIKERLNTPENPAKSDIRP